MDKEGLEGSVVAGLYQAAVQPDGWSSALKAALPLVNADSFHFVGWAKQPLSVDFNLVSHREFDEWIVKYTQYFSSVDPRRQFSESAAVGEVFLCQEMFSDEYVARSEFYQDFLLPSGHRYLNRPGF